MPTGSALAIMSDTPSWPSQKRTVPSKPRIRPARLAANSFGEVMPQIRHVAFVDASVPDVAFLVGHLRANVRVVVLGPHEPAFSQIARALAIDRKVEVVHIIAHGLPGEISFSAGRVSHESIVESAAELAAIRHSLKHGGEIRLWACNVAEGHRGRAFVRALATTCGVCVSASTRPIGAEALGGCWQLDEGSARGCVPPLTDRGLAGYASLLATYNATTGQDNFTGDSANDTVVVSDTNQIQSSDTFNAGAGTDAIQIGATAISPVSVDLSAAGTDGRGFLGFEALTFLNLAGTSSATFSSTQFGSGLISATLSVNGVGVGTQRVVVNMSQAGTFAVSGWTFNSWTLGTDSLTINGSSGNDTVVLGASSPVSATDTYNGGSGIDTIQVGATGNAGTSINFSAAAATARQAWSASKACSSPTRRRHLRPPSRRHNSATG
ncbi:DUF4347 domain-containing protein [Mesorhizobium sp.]|uniref:DUF4347 domain-containing protein n=1 Tax=Mesorhizobium sp. TaxID=1871066 RepID=UPI00257A7355|nr:DUF4347 domain-containing protein [Mesorhizobium sp.]